MALFYYFYAVNMTVTTLDYEFYLADYWMKKEIMFYPLLLTALIKTVKSYNNISVLILKKTLVTGKIIFDRRNTLTGASIPN